MVYRTAQIELVITDFSYFFYIRCSPSLKTKKNKKQTKQAKTSDCIVLSMARSEVHGFQPNIFSPPFHIIYHCATPVSPVLTNNYSQNLGGGGAFLARVPVLEG